MDLSSAIFLLFTTAIAWVVPGMVQDAQDNPTANIYEELRDNATLAAMAVIAPVIAPLCRYNATLFVGDSETSYYQLEELKRLNQTLVQMHISVRNVTEIGVAAFSVEAAQTPQWRRSDGALLGGFMRSSDVKKELRCL